ncbi:MAG: CsgG/HfaB family protein [bacterium]
MQKITLGVVSVLLAISLGLLGCAATGGGAARTNRTETVEVQPQPEVERYYGPKKRIAVVDFEAKSPHAGWDIGTGMAEMLITALHETGRFIVVERQAIKDIIQEQDLGTGGRVRPETAAKVGEILGAQILVRGAITEFEERETGGGVGGVFKGIGVGVGGYTAHVAVDIRMYDSTTGQILESHRSEGKARTRGLAVGTSYKNITFGGATFKKTPLGEATRQAIEDMVAFVVDKMELRPWEGRIIKAEGEKVYINAGEESGIKVGHLFDCYQVGEELIDPETGLSLGTEEEKRGQLQAVTVQEKYAIAKPVKGSGFKRGDIVRFTGGGE